MLIDKTTCWYNIDAKECLAKMGAGLHGDYQRMIEGLLDLIPAEMKAVIELGCGTGSAAKLFTDRYYTGVDLPISIDTIGWVVSPDLSFIKCDVVEDDISFISKYDIVYMDAFIDVMQYPLVILDKIFKNCGGYIVLIRQEIVDDETRVITNPSYNGFTYHTEIGRDDFDALLEKHNILIIKEVSAGIDNSFYRGEWKSLLLKKDD